VQQRGGLSIEQELKIILDDPRSWIGLVSKTDSQLREQRGKFLHYTDKPKSMIQSSMAREQVLDDLITKREGRRLE
jgi:hypothetical protein